MPLLSKKILLLLFLYFIQGLPYGFQSQFLPIHLRSLGHDLTNVTLLRLLHAPWFCKSLWAPLVDQHSTKRKWLLGSIFGLIITCLLGSFVSLENIGLLCAFLFALNLLAATQDIAVDGIAVSLLHTSELGSGNTAQVVGYKLGSIFGGGVLLWLLEGVGWFGLFLMLALLYLEAFMFVFVSPSLRDCECETRAKEDVNQRVSEWQRRNAGFEAAEEEEFVLENEGDESQVPFEDRDSTPLGSPENISEDIHKGEETDLDAPAKEDHEEYSDLSAQNRTEPECLSYWSTFKEMTSVCGTQWMMAFVLIYKLGEQGALGMLPLYLVDKHVAASDLALWSGVLGQAISIFGSLLGGWLITLHKIPVDFLLRQFCLLRLLPLGAQLLIVFASSVDAIPDSLLVCECLHSSSQLYFPDFSNPLSDLALGTMMLLLLLSGMVTTTTFTFMMQCSRLAPPSMQATHYTMLATLEVFGKLIFMTLAGWLVDRLGYPVMFLAFCGLTFLPFLWFRQCPKEFLEEQELESEDSVYEWQASETKEKND